MGHVIGAVYEEKISYYDTEIVYVVCYVILVASFCMPVAENENVFASANHFLRRLGIVNGSFKNGLKDILLLDDDVDGLYVRISYNAGLLDNEKSLEND